MISRKKKPDWQKQFLEQKLHLDKIPTFNHSMKSINHCLL
jgi:hypothetical protein